MKDQFAVITTFNKIVIAEVFERAGADTYKRKDLMAKEIKSKYDASTVARLSDKIANRYPGIFIWSRDRNQVVFKGDGK